MKDNDGNSFAPQFEHFTIGRKQENKQKIMDFSSEENESASPLLRRETEVIFQTQ